MRKTVLGSLIAALLMTAPLAAGTAQAQVILRGPSVRIGVAPPVARVEVVPVAPSRRHVWTPGHWRWGGRGHVWVAGRYIVAPRPGAVWVPARWVNEGGQWVFTAGYWSNQPVAPPPPVYEQPVYTPGPSGYVESSMAPPPPQEEMIPLAPSAQHLWVPGHWAWNYGRHVWVPGRFVTRRTGYVWQPAQWQRFGAVYRYVPGHWRPL